MKKIFVLLALVAFTGTIVVSAVTTKGEEVVSVYNNPVQNILQSADQGYQPTDTIKSECPKKAAEGDKKCSPDCKKKSSEKKSECPKNAE
ncbi:MAG: hypothetical protein JXB49_03555 [Bacteroidales bacterium]|nr:hypothetical protein [Bacteroidales bacterium]